MRKLFFKKKNFDLIIHLANIANDPTAELNPNLSWDVNVLASINICEFAIINKINKILITIKHLDTQEIEEGEFDIEKIENELIEKRHYASGNRWVPTKDIKNGYITNLRHTSLTSDSIALDYIIF